ncbi:hypothetical protein LZG04_00230 [Saccharothrix sp. S26]|uniref:hypothetical protein n=1 Tax=Saccharothrix sp. S26 TaxID=2907215 RepID=UPI001F39C729|nr:hypothetical protein [Saccharothrix sp. S26]MCE6993243.1 hypothetical protein [Saccharothrix sp. S26]
MALGGFAAATLSTGLLWSLTSALLVLAVGGVSVVAFAICTRRSEPWQRLVELVRLLSPEPRIPPPRTPERGEPRSLEPARNSR